MYNMRIHFNIPSGMEKSFLFISLATHRLVDCYKWAVFRFFFLFFIPINKQRARKQIEDRNEKNQSTIMWNATSLSSFSFWALKLSNAFIIRKTSILDSAMFVTLLHFYTRFMVIYDNFYIFLFSFYTIFTQPLSIWY